MLSNWLNPGRDYRMHRKGGRRPPKRPRLKVPGVEELEDRVVPTLLGQLLFPADNPFNQNISNAPVAVNSAAIIAHIGASTRVTPDWYADNPANGASPLYGIPFNIVHGNSTATVNVIIDNYPGESDMVPVPIPQNAVLEGDYQNGPNPNGAGYNPNQRGDSHLIVWDEDHNIAYELYGVSRPSDPTLFPNTSNVELPHTDGLWHAAQETVWDMNTDEFRTLGETSADAAGLSILAGLARPDEGLTVAQGGQGAINHALRVTLPGGDLNPQYIYPAAHMVGVSPGADNLPLGSRLRLENTPAIDNLISNMPPESQILARAMQQYGLIVADIGNAMYVSGAPATIDTVDSPNLDLTWDLTDIFASNGLETLTAGDFQVVNLTPVVSSLSVSSGPAGSTIFINGQNFSGAAGHLSVFFGNTPATSVTVLSDVQLSVTVPNGSGTVDVTVQSGVNETDNISSSPDANVNAPIFGYGTSAVTPADQFTFVAATPSFTNLSAPTITYGTASTIIAGHLQSNSAQPVPAGEMVQITLNGVMLNASLDGNDSFSASFNTGTLGIAGSPYTIGFAYAGDGSFQSANASSTLTVDAPLPVVQSIAIDNGAMQRSMVTSISITFNEQVTLAAGAIEVDRQGGGAEGLILNQSVIGGETIVDVTFSGSDIIGGSLADGRYTLTVHAALVHNLTAQAMASDASDAFFRLFGDARGTGTVDALDLQMFITAFRTHTNVGVFDYYGTGFLGKADLAQFLQRYGKHV